MLDFFIMNVKVTIDQIKELRNVSGAGISSCKEALEACDNNIEKAMQYITDKGLAKRTKISGRACEVGYIGLHESSTHVSCIEVLTETDFVSKSKKFRDACNDMAKFILDNPELISKTTLTISDFDHNKDLCNALLSLGENIIIGRVKVFDKSKGSTYEYIHNNPNSPANVYFSVVQLSQDHQKGPILAMQIATDMSQSKEIDTGVELDDSGRTIKEELGDCIIVDFIRGKVGDNH